MNRICALLVCYVMWFHVAFSQDSHELKLSGFGMWVQELPRDGAAALKLKHAWVIVDRRLDSNFSVRGMFAFAGPPKVVHSLFGRWEKPLQGIDYLRFGKFEPPFGHGTNFYRIDRNPTVNYSAIDAPVVARAHGIEAALHWQGLGMKFAGMSGERLLGNIPTAYENRWDMYIRPTYQLTQEITCGVSTRFGPVEAWGADVQAEVGSFHLELEGVSSRDTMNYTALGMYQVLPWLKPLVRYERILGRNQWTGGFSLKLPADAEIKANAVLTKDGLQTVLGQLVIRW